MDNDRNPGPGLLREAAELDRKILELVVRRIRLLKSTGGPAPELEKALRREWDKAAAPAAKDPARWRGLFSLLQELELAQPRGQDKDRTFSLSPRPGPLDADLDAPPWSTTVRLWMVRAYASGSALVLPAEVMADPAVELAKALNQAGGRFHWDRSGLMCRAGSQPDFADKTVYAGEDPFNLYLLLALALARPGRVRFTGGSGLKLADLGPVSRPMPLLGARLAPVVPRTSGLPVRMECSGEVPDAFHLPPDFPPLAALALAAAAPAYPRGLALAWDDPAPAMALSAALPVLAACSIAAREDQGSLAVPPGPGAPPERPAMDADPLLGAWFLALPRFTGGSMRLSGRWPAHAPEAAHALDMLRLAGLRLKEEGGRIEASYPKRPSGKIPASPLDSRGFPDYFPLAAALAAAAAHSAPDGASLARPGREDDLAACGELLSRSGFELPDTDGALLVRRAAATDEAGGTPAPWLSPSPAWSLAAALCAVLRPGLSLADPGDVTGLMPGFWNVYNRLTNPPKKPGAVQGKAKEKENGPGQEPGKPARRRIRT